LRLSPPGKWERVVVGELEIWEEVLSLLVDGRLVGELIAVLKGKLW
jgi:hypothetical protein